MSKRTRLLPRCNTPLNLQHIFFSNLTLSLIRTLLKQCFEGRMIRQVKGWGAKISVCTVLLYFILLLFLRMFSVPVCIIFSDLFIVRICFLMFRPLNGQNLKSGYWIRL